MGWTAVCIAILGTTVTGTDHVEEQPAGGEPAGRRVCWSAMIGRIMAAMPSRSGLKGPGPAPPTAEIGIGPEPPRVLMQERSVEPYGSRRSRAGIHDEEVGAGPEPDSEDLAIAAPVKEEDALDGAASVCGNGEEATVEDRPREEVRRDPRRQTRGGVARCLAAGRERVECRRTEGQTQKRQDRESRLHAHALPSQASCGDSDTSCTHW